MPCSHLPPPDAPDPLRVEDRWLTETVNALARGVVADLAFDRLPVLADALEDAGCDNFTLPHHLRSDEPHRVECWALRRLLRTTLMLPGGVPMVFAYCPPGTFLMGSDHEDAEDDERPLRRVRVNTGFYTGIHPVTQQQWLAVMGNNPSELKVGGRPVTNVSWEDAQRFCVLVSEGATEPIRLPTEVEWEYVCRGGTTTRFCFGDEPEDGRMSYAFPATMDPEHGWEGLMSTAYLHDVGKFPPNPWGLFDCHGNVWELCADRRDRDFSVVCRGGAWNVPMELCRSSYRHHVGERYQEGDAGFRVVFTA